jgi:hypothetical protein
LTFSLTLPGQLAFIVLANSTCNVTMTADAVFREAQQPLQIQQCTALPLDPSHHGVLHVASPSAGIQVPMALENGTLYHVLIAAQFAEGSSPCSMARETSVTARFTINPLDCQQPTCTCPSSAALQYLQPAIEVGNGQGLPVGPLLGEEVSCDSYAFTQRFMLLDGPRGGQSAVTVKLAGQPLYNRPDKVRQSVQSSGQSLLRPPTRLQAVLQNEQFNDEDDLASGPRSIGRRATYRCIAVIAICNVFAMCCSSKYSCG